MNSQETKNNYILSCDGKILSFEFQILSFALLKNKENVVFPFSLLLSK